MSGDVQFKGTQEEWDELVKSDRIKREFAEVINRYSLENDSNTPDFILAEYIYDCLKTFAKTSRSREEWYGKELTIM